MIYYLRAYIPDFLDHRDKFIQYTSLISPYSIYPYIYFNDNKWELITGPLTILTFTDNSIKKKKNAFLSWIL